MIRGRHGAADTVAPGIGSAPSSISAATIVAPGQIQQILNYVSEAGNTTGLRGEILNLARDYLQKNNITSDTLIPTKGPGVNQDDLIKTFIVPILKLVLGLKLNTHQLRNSVAFEKLLSTQYRKHSESTDLFTGDQGQGTPVFVQQMTMNEQRYPEEGTYLTAPLGTGQEMIRCEIKLKQYTAGFNVSTPVISSVVDATSLARALYEELTKLRTTWELNSIREHVVYCMNQPVLAELILKNVVADNAVVTLGHLLSAVQLDNLLTGSINRSPSHIKSLIAAACGILKMSPDELVMVLPQTVFTSLRTDKVVCHVPCRRDVITYRLDRAVGMDFKFLMGEIERLEEISEEATEPHSAVAVTADRSGEYDVATGLNMDGVSVDDGIVPVIPLDNTKFGPNVNTRVEAEMMSEITKRTFFTVGSAPPVYHSLMSPQLYTGSDSMEITPAHIALRAPHETTLINASEAMKIIKITTNEIHRVFNTPAAFDHAEHVLQWHRIPEDAYDVFNELDCADLYHLPTWEEKIKNVQSCFEANPRFMLHKITEQANGQAQLAARIVSRVQLGAVRSVIVLDRRVCMFDSSPMNMQANEYVGVLSSMLAKYPAPKDTDDLGIFLHLMNRSIRDNSVDFHGAFFTWRTNATDAHWLVLAEIIERNPSGCMLLTHPAVQNELMRRMLVNPLPGAVGNAVLSPTLCAVATILRNGQHALCSHFYRMFPDGHSILSDGAFNPVLVGNLSGAQRLCAKILEVCLFQGVTSLYVHIGANALPAPPALARYQEKLFPEMAYSACHSASVPQGIQHARAYDVFERNDNVESMLYSAVWRTRARAAAGMFADLPYHAVLLGLHYSTQISMDALKRMDVDYYSGWSYLCIKTDEAVGYGASIIPRKSALQIYGNSYQYGCKNNLTYTGVQVCESAMAPKCMINSLGTYLPNLFLDKFTSQRITLDPLAHHPLIIMDCYNGFVPEGDRSYGPVSSILPIIGKYSADNGFPDILARDVITDTFYQLPSLNPLVAWGYSFVKSVIEVDGLTDPGHPFVSYLEAVGNTNHIEGIPIFIRDPTAYEPANIFQRITAGNQSVRSALTRASPFMFIADFVIGKGFGSQTLWDAPEKLSHVEAALQPRIIGESLVGPFTPSHNYQFFTKLMRTSSLTLSNRVNINEY